MYFYPLSAEMWGRRQGPSPHRNTQPPPSPLHPPVGASLVSLCDLSHAQTNPPRASGIEHPGKGSGGPCAAVNSPVWPFHLPFTIPPSHKPRSRPCTHPAQPLQFAPIPLQEIHPPPPPPLAHLSSCHPPCSKPSTLRSTSPLPLPSPPSRLLPLPTIPPSRSRSTTRPKLALSHGHQMSSEAITTTGPGLSLSAPPSRPCAITPPPSHFSRTAHPRPPLSAAARFLTAH